MYVSQSRDNIFGELCTTGKRQIVDALCRCGLVFKVLRAHGAIDPWPEFWTERHSLSDMDDAPLISTPKSKYIARKIDGVLHMAFDRYSDIALHRLFVKYQLRINVQR